MKPSVLVAAVAGALALVPAVAACDQPAAGAEQPPPVVDGWWRSDLDRVPAGTAERRNGTARALAQQWSHYGQGQEDAYGHPAVVPAAGDDLPEPPAGGDHVIRLDHEPGDPATERKLYKSFSARSWPSGAEPFRQDDGSPEDVSGRYIVYEYVSSARLHLTDRGWINLAQLKEGYAAEDGTQTSDPSWWLVLYQRDGNLFADLAHWKEGEIAGPRLDFRPYLDRWVKIELRVYQHDRIEVYLDDQLFDTGRQEEYPVGRMHYPGRPVDGTGPVVTRPEGWIFGAGNYSNPEDPGSGSLVHVALATVLPLP
jgi:hypothetical protein